jgi:thiol-disulfide isomerase/thioredoxin
MKTIILTLFFFAPITLFAQAIEERTVDFITQLIQNKSDTVYVINFWATWCKPCIEELPAFQKLDSLYKTKKVKVILFSLDSKKQVGENLIPFLKNKNISCTVYTTNVVDFNKRIDEISTNWSGAIPATLISGKTNTGVFFFEKPVTFEELEKIIQPLITKP